MCNSLSASALCACGRIIVISHLLRALWLQHCLKRVVMQTFVLPRSNKNFSSGNFSIFRFCRLIIWHAIFLSSWKYQYLLMSCFPVRYGPEHIAPWRCTWCWIVEHLPIPTVRCVLMVFVSDQTGIVPEDSRVHTSVRNVTVVITMSVIYLRQTTL